jgi:hypothetical protein
MKPLRRRLVRHSSNLIGVLALAGLTLAACSQSPGTAQPSTAGPAKACSHCCPRAADDGKRTQTHSRTGTANCRTNQTGLHPGSSNSSTAQTNCHTSSGSCGYNQASLKLDTSRGYN